MEFETPFIKPSYIKTRQGDNAQGRYLLAIRKVRKDVGPEFDWLRGHNETNHILTVNFHFMLNTLSLFQNNI